MPKSFLKFCLIFGLAFCAFYFGFKVIYGAAVEGGVYFPFVDKYFDVASWLRQSLLNSSKFLLNLFNINAIKLNEFVLSYEGRGIKLIYGCLGIAVYSFWIAYMVATSAKNNYKLKWLFAGLLLLWVINVARISLVLVSIHKNWQFPFGLDHHTWFNIISYLFIFAMIFFFEKNIKLKDAN